MCIYCSCYQCSIMESEARVQIPAQSLAFTLFKYCSHLFSLQGSLGSLTLYVSQPRIRITINWVSKRRQMKSIFFILHPTQTRITTEYQDDKYKKSYCILYCIWFIDIGLPLIKQIGLLVKLLEPMLPENLHCRPFRCISNLIFNTKFLQNLESSQIRFFILSLNCHDFLLLYPQFWIQGGAFLD